MPKLDRETAKAVHEAEGSAYTLLDEDEYLVKLDKVAIADKPDKNGNTYWIWTFTVISGQMTGDKFKGKQLGTNTGFSENQLWFAKMVFDAFEVNPNVDTDTLLGKEVKALVGQREIQQGRNKGKMSNDVQTLLPASASAEADDDWAGEDTEAIAHATEADDF